MKKKKLKAKYKELKQEYALLKEAVHDLNMEFDYYNSFLCEHDLTFEYEEFKDCMRKRI